MDRLVLVKLRREEVRVLEWVYISFRFNFMFRNFWCKMMVKKTVDG